MGIQSSTWTITASVGEGGINKPIDVALIQDMLNQSGLNLSVTGLYSPDLGIAIKQFQKQTLKGRPDGLVSKHGPTLLRLQGKLAASYQGPKYLSSNPSTAWSLISSSYFADFFALQFSDRARQYKYTTARPAGLKTVFLKLCNDTDIADYRWAAYMLATCQRECPGFVPISEYGKGAGRPYGNPEVFTAKDGKKYTNTYYGRGYVQLTWDYNYLSIGKAIGVGEALAIDADKALDPEIAYDVMSYGMRNGKFTGRKLSDYITGTSCDYVHARRIINGLDHAAEIADCAQQIERLILLTVPQFMDKPVLPQPLTTWA